MYFFPKSGKYTQPWTVLLDMRFSVLSYLSEWVFFFLYDALLSLALLAFLMPNCLPYLFFLQGFGENVASSIASIPQGV